MAKPTTFYRIETFWEHDQSWHVTVNWYAMNRSKADGAWMVLKAFIGGRPDRYRLVKYVGVDHFKGGDVVEEHCTPGLRLN